MDHNIACSIYGQRFLANQKIARDPAISLHIDWLLPEFNVYPGIDLQKFADDLASMRITAKTSLVIPVLNLDLASLASPSQKVLRDIAKVLGDGNMNRVVVAIDEDNEIIHGLSPRLSDESTRNATAVQSYETIHFLSQYIPEILVALTVEELCPGGFDPTDAIVLAKQLVEAGATGIIASGGCSDFPPLKNRRQTRQKGERENDWSFWPETWMCSAQWLVSRLGVPIFAQGPVGRAQQVIDAASRYGFAGIVDTSVKDPSSPLSMA